MQPWMRQCGPADKKRPHRRGGGNHHPNTNVQPQKHSGPDWESVFTRSLWPGNTNAKDYQSCPVRLQNRSCAVESAYRPI